MSEINFFFEYNPQHPFSPYVATPFLPYVRNRILFCLFFLSLETLVSAAAQGEREGAAQGLAEVLAALGDQKLEGLMPTLLEGASRRDARAREGFALLWVQLPSTLGERFARHLVDVLPLVLSGLADEAEPVREACLQACIQLPVLFK